MTPNDKPKINVLHLICPTGYYGAERWIVALAKNIDSSIINTELAITSECPSNEMKLISAFKTENMRTHRLEMTGRFDFSVLSKIRNIIKTREIHVLHTHGYKSDILGYLAARLSSIPVISTPHGYGDGKKFKLNMYIKLGSLFLAKHNLVIPLSDALTEETRRLGVSSAKIKQINNGVDLTEMPHPHMKPVKTDLKKLGYVGQLIPRKRIHEILLAFDQLWKNDKTLTLHIVGDGSEYQNLVNQANSLRCYNAITFYGFIEDRLELMRSLDILLLTSESEGIPRVLMEAQAQSIPVIAYNIDGVNQLIIRDKSGLLVELGDIPGLVTACSRLTTDPCFAALLAERGRERVTNEFSAKSMGAQYCQVYQSLANF